MVKPRDTSFQEWWDNVFLPPVYMRTEDDVAELAFLAAREVEKARWHKQVVALLKHLHKSATEPTADQAQIAAAINSTIKEFEKKIAKS